jgi:hypothetical protein
MPLFGTVGTVNGSSAPGTCGVAGTAGTFTVTHKMMTDTVDVGGTTPVYDRGSAAPSFADVCVGVPAGAIGSLSATTLIASVVFVPTATAPSPLGPGPRGTSSGVSTSPMPETHDQHHGDDSGPSSSFGRDDGERDGAFAPSHRHGDGPSHTHGWSGGGWSSAGGHDSPHGPR